MTMQLCGVSVSPYFERVYTALDMKGALDALTYPGVPGGFKSEEHFKHHPMGMVPFLIKDDGSSLTEGQLIAEYLDDILKGPSLMPADPDKAAQVKVIARIFDLYYYAAQRPMGSAYFGGEETEEDIRNAREVEIPKALKYIEKYVDGGAYAVGDSWTHADAVFITQLYWYETVGGKYGLDGFGDCGKIADYWASVKETDVAQRSFERVSKSYEQFFGGQS